MRIMEQPSNRVRTKHSVSMIPEMLQMKIEFRPVPPNHRIPHLNASRLLPAVAANQLKKALQTTPTAAKHNRTIRARDYKPLELPEPRAVCSVCGKKGSSHVEKFTAERKARPKDQQDARRVCRSCYKAAVKAEQEASVPLPGTVDVSPV